MRVRALTYTNKGGEKRLQLEMILLDGGVTVSRTANDLVRYHGKMMIIDARVVHVYGFNFTRLDVDKSRSRASSPGIPGRAGEAIWPFDADFDRKVGTPRAATGSSSALRTRVRG